MSTGRVALQVRVVPVAITISSLPIFNVRHPVAVTSPHIHNLTRQCFLPSSSILDEVLKSPKNQVLS